MKKILTSILLVAAASMTFAQGQDPYVEDRFDTICNGVNRDGQINDLLVLDDAAIRDDANIGGDMTVSGAVTFAVGQSNGRVNTNTVAQVFTPVSVNATNTYTVPATARVYLLQNTSAVVSNNVNLANPPNGAGQDLLLVNISTNSIWIGDASNIVGAAVLLGTGDTISFFSTFSTQWTRNASTDN